MSAIGLGSLVGCTDEGSTFDAAVDSRVADSMPPDQGRPDLSQLDTSQPDMPQPDTSLPDISLPDISPPDVGQPDTEVRDVGPYSGWLFSPGNRRFARSNPWLQDPGLSIEWRGFGRTRVLKKLGRLLKRNT
jgi:hypothetical protein